MNATPLSTLRFSPPPAASRRAFLRVLAAGTVIVGMDLTGVSSLAMPRMARPIDVQGTVYAGPSAGLEISGRLWLDLTDGDRIPSGVLLRADGSRAADVSGRMSGNLLMLDLFTVDGERLTLVGRLASDIYTDDETIHGTLSGPESGDYGEWQGTWASP